MIRRSHLPSTTPLRAVQSTQHVSIATLSTRPESFEHAKSLDEKHL